MEIEINGVKYRSIDTERPEKSPSKKLSILSTMAMAFSGSAFMMPEMPRAFKSSVPPGTDIIKEFELIGQKRSTLSANQRREVIGIFLSQFKPIN